MARVYPFRAWRYNPTAVRLDDVLTQPYDKITPAMQQAYYQRSPFNLVRIVLGLPELFDAEPGESVYSRAACDFRAWRKKGILTQEKEPCVFAYAQRFRVPGTEKIGERRGFIALGRLYDYSEQVVFPHEKTLSEPKSDRLNLLKATRAQFEPILMLYSDPARSIEQILFDGSGRADDEVTDEYGVLHRLWRVSDASTIRLLTTVMADKKLIIADGHHRYETALEYGREHCRASTQPAERITTQLPHLPYPEAAALTAFVNMDSEGLVILPTHRVVHNLAGFDPAAFIRSAEKSFAVETLPAADAGAYLKILRKEQGPAFVVVTRAGAFLLRSKPDAIAAALASIPERLRQLDLTVLHSLVLNPLLGADMGDNRLRYLRDADEAVDQVYSGQADAAFLTTPITMEQLREVAFAGDVMPPKSTDFFPKLLSGLAIYALE